MDSGQQEDRDARRALEDEQELNIRGPGGLGFSFKGSQLFPAILVLLLAFGIGYMIYIHDGKGDARYKENIAALNKVATIIEKSESTQRAMIYVLTLSPVEREKLNLMKPRELSEMQR